MTRQTVSVHIDEMIDRDREGFLDLISELAANSPLLMDIHYKVAGVGLEPGTIQLEVWGDDSLIEKEEEHGSV